MVLTIEKPKKEIETLDNLAKRELTPAEIAAEDQRAAELNSQIYGDGNLTGVQVDTDQVLRASALDSSISDDAWSDIVRAGVPVDPYNTDSDIQSIGTQVQNELRLVGSTEQANDKDIEARVLGGHIDQAFQDEKPNERLDQRNASEVKNALIGQRYMNAWQNKTPEDIDLLKKLPIEVFSDVALKIYQLEKKYGSSDKVTNQDLAAIGESVIVVAMDSSNNNDEAEPKLVYGDETGKLVIQTPEQAIDQIAAGDDSVISSINDPEIKKEITSYIDTLNVFYADGLVGIDESERAKLQTYLVAAFKAKGYVE